MSSLPSPDAETLRALARVQAESRSMLEMFRQPAILLTPTYRILAANQAYVDRHGPVEPGRTRCHERSHGSDLSCDEVGGACPVRTALASGQAERVLHVHHTRTGPEHCDVSIRPIRDDDGEVLYLLEVIDDVVVVGARAGAPNLVGSSAAFNTMVGLLQRAAPSDVPVLLLGETGTGKELAARAVHDASHRKRGPFVIMECAGLTETLFESEVFGHERGSFTGANARRVGLVEGASGGTLFLDEVGDIPLSMQVKLLRLLESHRFRRVGGTDLLPADFRLVAATHRDLARMVNLGEFREDLLYRINAFTVRVPSLRERRSDIPELVFETLAQSGCTKRVTPEAMRVLLTYDWPGNIRELRNVLLRATLLADGEEIDARHIQNNSDRALGEPPRAPGPAAGRWEMRGAEPRPMPPTDPGLDLVAPRDARLDPLDQLVAAFGSPEGFSAEFASYDDFSDRALLRWVDAWDAPRSEIARCLGMSERTLYRRIERARARLSEAR